MCIKDKKMTNSAILQFIIEELSKSQLSWDGDKELFELICAPLSYGDNIYKKCKNAKQTILDIFNQKDEFDEKKFNSLANNIICGENKAKHIQSLLDFLKEQILFLNISTDVDINQLIQKIPCKKEGEKSYKSNFGNWKNGNTDRINRREVKQRIEQNFYFSPSLWDQGEYTIKQTIREGIAQFIKKQTQEIEEINNLFEEIRREFNMKNSITTDEIKELENIEDMTQTQVMEYISKHYPLKKHRSQEFIQKMIPILYKKGYYELLLDDVIQALDIHLQDSNHIKKIKANIYGSSIMGEYLKAFNILSLIESDDDTEIVDMRTEAISNIRRHYLSDITIDKEQKKYIIDMLKVYYKNTFELNNTFHYYPAINLVYILIIESILFDNEQKKQKLSKTINNIYEKCKPSILADQKSDNLQNRYYANITELEFMLLRGTRSPIAELERFLELEEKCIPLSELSRTQRQMQFFVDTITNLHSLNNPILEKIQRAIEVIDDFIEFRGKV